MKLHVVTINDLIQRGHFLNKVFLTDKPKKLIARMIDNGIFIKCPNSMYVELFKHEFNAVSKHHKIIWEEKK